MSGDLDNLQSRIRKARDATPSGKDAKRAETPDDSEGSNMGIRAVTDLVVTPIVCGGIGIGLDRWFGTGPVFFILLAFLGLLTGFWNLYRMMNGADSAVGFKRLQNKEKEGNKARLSGKDLDT